MSKRMIAGIYGAGMSWSGWHLLGFATVSGTDNWNQPLGFGMFGLGLVMMVKALGRAR